MTEQYPERSTKEASPKEKATEDEWRMPERPMEAGRAAGRAEERCEPRPATWSHTDSLPWAQAQA